MPLPVAHDALTARLITRAGFRAHHVGGFALAGTRGAFEKIIDRPTWVEAEKQFGKG
jgi:2-methylisocitrate lyase-like PEP mutase family enzyme